MFALVVALLSIPGLGHSAQTGDTADETAVRGVVKAYVDARDRSDAAAIRALFTDDADQLTSSGEWRKGREDLVRGTLASSKGNPGTRTIAIETVRFPSLGVAIADGRYEIAGAAGARSAADVDVFPDGQGEQHLADCGDPEHAAGTGRGVTEVTEGTGRDQHGATESRGFRDGYRQGTRAHAARSAARPFGTADDPLRVFVPPC